MASWYIVTRMVTSLHNCGINSGLIGYIMKGYLVGSDLMMIAFVQAKVRNELRSVGAQCRGERHVQVIERQREALVELRARLKALDGSATAEPTGQYYHHIHT